VCTAHPNEARVAGVDFDGIVRAVLRGRGGGGGAGRTAGGVGGGGGGDALGFEVFDKTATAGGDDDDDENDNEGPSSSSRAGGKKASSTSSTATIVDHCLGEMEGTMWTRLAEYHVRAGDFELARSVYEEALDAISRVRDFSLVFDAYVKFEEGVIEALMELMEEEEEEEKDMDDDDEQKAPTDGNIKESASAADDDEDLDILLGDGAINTPTNDDDTGGSSADVDLAISRAEHLTSRRPLLLNRVLLRQNPHNVGEWIKRSKLYLDLDEIDMAASALEESLKAVSSRKSVNGSPCTLVLTLVDVHENRRRDVDSARGVLERICAEGEYDFQDAEDLAQCHASWVELELRWENWDVALNLARRAVSGRVGTRGSKAARGLSRSLRLWNLLFDLEASLGTVQTTKDAYDRALELKVATPSHVLNYASFLRDKKYFEESFAAYERGLGLFPFPHAGATLLWKNYLTNFLERYGGSKTPRARELFDRCLDDCPSEESPEFYLLYGDYEETHGLTKRALGVYERMCNSVPPSERYTAYRLYIAKAIQYLGVTSARPIYEAAISALEDGPASRICLEYAKMETGLREVDRARTVLVYGSQLADPRRDPDYWKAWHEFEVSFGNEETFREMLRVKRSVQAAFSTVNYNAAEMGAGVPQLDTMTEDAALEMIAEREGVSVEKKPLVGGFVSGKKRTAEAADLGEVERRATRLREAAAVAFGGSGGGGGGGGGGDEIDIDDEDDDEAAVEEEEEQVPAPPKTKIVKGVSEKVIPAAVFGGLTASGNSQN
jgi:pre-mRNA-splicing factor SYF1